MTAGTYGLLGIVAGFYFRNRDSSVKNYLSFSIVATIIYDAITGIGSGMLFFHQSFLSTFIGQVPFTLYHLAGNAILAGLVSPLLYKWVLDNPSLDTKQILGKLTFN